MNASSPVRLRPTPQCLILAVLGVFMLWASINYSNNAAYFVLFSLIGVATSSAFMARSNLRGLEVNAHGTLTAFENAECSPVIHLAASPHACESLHLHLPDREVIESSSRVDFLEANQQRAHALSFPVPERGKFLIAELEVSSTFPLGFWEVRRRAAVQIHCTVYPSPRGDLPWPDENDVDPNEEDDGTRQGGSHFAGHRAYQTGESQRHIDWKAWSRGKGLLVKDFRGGGGGNLCFDFQAVPLSNTEDRLRQLSRWIVDAHREDLLWELRLPGSQLGPDRGVHHYNACMTALAIYGKEDQR